MAASSTSFQPGQSGNPKGRPPKTRALTSLLETVGKTKYRTGGKIKKGKRAGQDEELAAKTLFATHVWEGLATGQIRFPGGHTLKLDGAEYIGLAKFVLGQIDGPPKAELDVTSEGKSISSTPTLDSMKDLLQMMGQREKDDSRPH